MTKFWAWSGYKLFDTNGIPERVFLKEVDFEKHTQKQEVTKSMKNYPIGKELNGLVQIL